MAATRLSRYEFNPVETDDQGRIFLDLLPPPSRDVLLQGAARHTVIEGDTPWTIAWAAYKETLDQEQDIRPTALFDVICHANDLVDPLAPLEVGRVIFVPTVETVFGRVRVPPAFGETS